MTETLPDELLDDVLAHSLALSPTDFLAFPDEPGSGPPRSSGPVLVSKRWLRIGTPHLYACVRLAKPAHTAAVAALLRAQPHVGRAVRCLRLEGGLGRELVHVAAAAPRLERLYVAMCVKAAESVAGLRSSLPLLRPRHLYLENDGGARDNQKAVEVRQALQAYLQSAEPSLEFMALSDEFHGMDEVWASAIAASSVEELSCRSSSMEGWIVDGVMHTMLQDSRPQRVVCRGTYRESSVRLRLQRKGLAADIEKFAFIRHLEDHKIDMSLQRRKEHLSRTADDEEL
ncbi:hypothetical protein PsYK624_080780 [Phanerochaete sordida]|uniref:Uncharacterized protein n=1 Tax=Phanerochaete sordida TaxID=48140 RepID=A0A9P3GBP4_9APHY|nr:hypothetical protein PsYK624_080780 [Phanerochaete sordida]